MNEKKQQLIDAVLEQIKENIAEGDLTAIEELLRFVPLQNLIQFLPEEVWKNYYLMTFEDLVQEIAENVSDGYETAILGKNMKAVKYGSLISEENDLPDTPENCCLRIWNNNNIDNVLGSYKRIDL